MYIDISLFLSFMFEYGLLNVVKLLLRGSDCSSIRKKYLSIEFTE